MLGFVGQHNEIVSLLPVSTLLLGLCDRLDPGRADLGLYAGKYGRCRQALCCRPTGCGFLPHLSRSMLGEGAPGPYAVAMFFTIGVALCAVPFNYLLMRKPLDKSEAVSMSGYSAARGSWHLWGILGGVIWCTGATFNFVASRAHIAAAALSVTRPGAQTSMPRMVEVEQMLAGVKPNATSSM